MTHRKINKNLGLAGLVAIALGVKSDWKANQKEIQKANLQKCETIWR